MTSTPRTTHTPLQTPTAFGTLSRNPPEIRLKIYREVLLDGSVRILESSKAIYGEAISVLLQEGVCRLEFDGYIDSFPSPDHCGTIMNLEIHLVMTYSSRSKKGMESLNEWLARFLDCKYTRNAIPPTICEPTPRKSCKILIDCENGPFPLFPGNTVELIKYMDGFSVLALAIAND